MKKEGKERKEREREKGIEGKGREERKYNGKVLSFRVLTHCDVARFKV